MKFKKRVLIGLGIMTFLVLMVLNVQLVQNPTGTGGGDFNLVQLSASASGEGFEGGTGHSLFHFLRYWWNDFVCIVFGGPC